MKRKLKNSQHFTTYTYFVHNPCLLLFAFGTGLLPVHFWRHLLTNKNACNIYTKQWVFGFLRELAALKFTCWCWLAQLLTIESTAGMAFLYLIITYYFVIA
jgi:hypothetical protein